MVDYTKAIMGENAVHIPFNFIRQKMDNMPGVVKGEELDGIHGLILGQEIGNTLAFGATMTHVLVKGDMIFRPHLVIESNMLIGVGAAGIITSGMFCDVDEWKRPENNILLEK